MYYKMDITQFPIVFVDFFNITNDINLDDFLNEWKQLYNKQKTEIADVCTIIQKCTIHEISKYLLEQGEKKDFPDITARE